MAHRYTLHGVWLSGPAYKVALTLSLMGQKFNYRHWALRQGEHKTPAFEKMNRYTQVPVLEDHKKGLTLVQSSSILQYLAKTHRKFDGANEQEKINAREWQLWGFERLGPPVYRLRAMRLGFRQFAQPTAEMYHGEAKAALDFLEAWLKTHAWLVGNQMTYADIDIYGTCAYAGAAGYPLEAYPAIHAWVKKIESQKGFAKAQDIMPQG